MVGNLVSNAIKSSPEGGPITLRIGREAAAWRANRDWAGLSVRDQGIGGIGIPPAGLPFIFGRFQRAGNVAGHLAGTGIGLASVRQIVEQRGATVTVASRAGTGATFTVRLSMRPRQENGP